MRDTWDQQFAGIIKKSKRRVILAVSAAMRKLQVVQRKPSYQSCMAFQANPSQHIIDEDTRLHLCQVPFLSTSLGPLLCLKKAVGKVALRDITGWQNCVDYMTKPLSHVQQHSPV